MNILDLAGANQGTVSFVTNYGHGLYSDDLLVQMDEAFGDVDFFENQLSPRRVSDFLGALSTSRTITSTARCCGTRCNTCLAHCWKW